MRPAASAILYFDGPVGTVETLVDAPPRDACGVAIVAHPQPLLGGNATHKIPQLLARALCDAGWLVIRPNFRGVGSSAGQHDGGAGEADDLLALVAQLRAGHGAAAGLAAAWHCADERLALIGFSFGAHVQARVASSLKQQGHPPWRVCLAGMPSGKVDGGRRYDTPTDLPEALVIHGELDERVPLASIMHWARARSHPVVVVPDADHFFSGKLHVLRSLVLAHLTIPR